MKWEEVRKIYPNRFVKMQVLQGRIENNIRYIDEVEIINAFEDNKEATMELARAKNNIIVFHTSNEKLKYQLKEFLVLAV